MAPATGKRMTTENSYRTVVAVGALATSTAGLEQFLTVLPAKMAAAVVLTLQHREALDEAGFTQRLRAAGRELTLIEDGAQIQPGHIYLPPPDVIVAIEAGRFQVQPAEQDPGARGTIDSFLVSLARDGDTHPIAVLFADTGGEGTLGAAAVKEAGGLVLAEQTREHSGEALQTTNSPAALADTLLSPAELADQVARYVVQLQSHDDALQLDKASEAAALTGIATVLRNKTGHDFHGYKSGTFLRRILRRMQVVEVQTFDDYIEILRADPDEPLNLFNDLLIGVTQFFRDQREFDVLQSQVIPKLFENKTRHDQLRVWVIGCSTGEEAYSIAILLREHMATLDEVPHVQIFASDLDGRALASARAGRYSDALTQDVSPERLARWFVKEGNTYCVVKELREMCIFSQHSIIKDAPFSRLDLVSCRNLLIYLDAEMQSRVIPLFHFALNAGGYLFLGNSENVSRHASLFAPVEARSRIYVRLDTGRRVLPDFPFTATSRTLAEQPPAPRSTAGFGDRLAKSAERIAERYAPAYIIVDRDHNILHFSGKTGRFLEPAGGAASLDLLNLVHQDLRSGVRAALSRAIEQNETVHITNLVFGSDANRQSVDLVVEPLPGNSSGSGNLVVLFKDSSPVWPQGVPTYQFPPADTSTQVQRLESQLRTTSERLQSTVEELESTNEELKSANEEYQSLNEELQSANEELETSKEELQSVNEELTTVNSELAHRVQELGRANSDLKNLLESTQIATVFLDNDLRVMNYTPAATEIFPLVAGDIGRPIVHIKSRVAFDDLQDDIRRVLRTLGSAEREMESASTGHLYMVRVLPYRSVDNFIGGVVLTFVDITARKKAEEALRDREERFRLLVAAAHDYSIFTTDPDGIINEWLPGAAAIFGWSAEEAVGQNAEIIYTPEDRADGLWEMERAEAQATGRAGDNRWHMRKDGTRVFIEGSAQALRDSTGRIWGILKIGQDVTLRRQSEAALRESEGKAKLLLAELQHRVRNTLAVVRSITRRTAATSETVEEFGAHLDGRLNAFARVQTAVTRDPKGGIDLERLIADELYAYRAAEGEKVTHITGPKVLLRSKAGEIVGLAVHELATNAVKYGALSSPKGHIDVSWRIEGDSEQRLVLTWVETGVDLSEGSPRRHGFGTELLERTIAYELDGQADLQFTPNGVRCTITLPLSEQLVLQPGNDNPKLQTNRLA